MIRPRLASQTLLLGVIVLFSSVALLAQPTIKRETARRADSLEGPETYKTYCAVCHGMTGKGDGPAATALKTPPADLTAYAKRHGEFSRVDVREVIEGERMIAAHGTRDMPIWGDVFRSLYSDRTMRDLLINNLLTHIESMQAK
jgi:mono/diheme cytochrome c family protein